MLRLLDFRFALRPNSGDRQHRDVVCLPEAAGSFGNRARGLSADFPGAVKAEHLAGSRLCLNHTIGEEGQRISGLQLNPRLWITAVESHAQRHAGIDRDLDALFIWGQMSGVHQYGSPTWRDVGADAGGEA